MKAGQPVTPPRADALWLAVYLPWLAGEVMGGEPASPLVISEESARGWLIYRASPGARARGVCPGMTVSAAGVLCPGLVTRRRRRRREQQRLETIGDWMTAFSPVVSIQAPETVLLEVRGSLNLFGGSERLRARIAEQLGAAGHVYRIAGAPVPLAAQCLAHWGHDGVVEEKAALRSALGAMPAGLLDLEAKTLKRLERAGIHTLRDLWRLPVDGPARRFGDALARKLDRLRGAHPDPRPLHTPPPHFYSVLTLHWATDDLAQITRGLECLLCQWTDYLRRAGRGTSGFTIECRSDRGNHETRVDVGVRHVSRDIEAGWWDQRDQRRDYYIAVDQRGRRLWLFRDLRHRQWYLHGLFA